MTRNDAEIISEIYDAALEPGRWLAAIRSISQSLDASGGVYLVVDRRTGSVRSAAVSGPMAEMTSEYIEHYAPIDPFASALQTTPVGQWKRVSEIATADIKRANGWYNEFFRRSGLTDMIGVSLFDDGQWIAMLGVHEDATQKPISQDRLTRFRPVLDALQKAAKLHHDLHHMGWKSTVALRALEQAATGVIITDGSGRLIESNAAADRILSRDDGIIVRSGYLSTRRVFETAKLAKMIATASARQGETASDHMLVVRAGGGAPYTVTVSPLSAGLAMYEQPLTMILVADPDEHRPSQETFAALFGFSAAESHLAVALMRGRSLAEIAQDRGVRITTIRTQLSSMLKKTGAARQADLVRILAGAQLIDANAKSDA